MSFDTSTQARKARDFLALHHDARLLILPNVWDALGARMLESLGFPAVATASAAVAYSLGHDDGERIGFDAMRGAVARIAGAVDVPVTADIERGYADSLDDLAANIRGVIRAGAVGVNIEDSFEEGGALRSPSEQCERIRAVRAAAADVGVPLVINARVDTYLAGAGSDEERFDDTVSRARAYLEAGADCIYPIVLADLAALARLKEATGAPINVFVWSGSPPLRELEAAGMARVSVGPGWIKASATAMRDVAVAMRDYNDGPLTDGVMSSDEIKQYVINPRKE